MPRKAASQTPTAAAKRLAEDTPTRQSKRARATAKKSYAEPDTDDDDENSKKQKVASDDEDNVSEASGFEDSSEGDPSSDSEPADATSDEDTTLTSHGKAKKKSLPIHKKQADEQELWKPGAKLTLGTQLIIKKPKARDAGNTPYTDETIHPNTMLFLKDLAANNDRQWLKLHDPDFRAAFQDFTSFIEKVSEKVVEADELVPELPVKDVIYRIYRDVRFSKDPTPYKTYFSAAWSRTGRKGPYAHYYVQVQPEGGSFVGGGFWQPEASALAKLRRDIHRKPHKIKRVLIDNGIRTSFLGNVSDNESKAIKAFVNSPMNKSSALKRHPKGYEQDHKEIDLLRLRNYTLGRKLSDHEITGPGGLQRVAELIVNMVPFVTYLNSVVMPDEESSDSNGGESSEGEDSHDDDNATA